MRSDQKMLSMGLMLGLACFSLLPGLPISAQTPEAGQNAARRVGAIKAIEGTTITLTPDSGADVTVVVQPAARIVRIAPGEKNLKNATPIQLQDLQVGDRILVGGKSSDDAKSLAASSVVVMKRSDVETHQEQQRQDWQKRGLGGLVSKVDSPAGAVTITMTGFAGTKTVVVHTSGSTVFRRYAPDSVKFDDAKSSSLGEVQAGDQLRARGDRSADGAEFTAEEIVTGTFKNVAGIITSVDPVAGTLSIQDVLSKKAVQVRVTAESQLRKLPPEIAQRMAMRLKGSAPGSQQGSASQAAPEASANSGQAAPATRPNGGTGGGMRTGGAPDLQQMLNRMPTVAIADLHKGDAVMIVTTQGTASSGGTAITLLAGVEPIMQAAPNGSQAMMLAPWSLGGPSGDAASQ